MVMHVGDSINGSFVFQAEDGIGGSGASRGLGDVYERQASAWALSKMNYRALIFARRPRLTMGG